MKSKFCPKCGAILIPHWEDEKLFLRCGKCLYHSEVPKDDALKVGEDIPEEEDKGEGVLNEENTLATYHHECPKCGYGKCQVIDMGQSYSDEDNLILLKCGKCGWSERVGRPG